MLKQTRDIKELERLARMIRADIVRMVGIDMKGHLGGRVRRRISPPPSISTKCASIRKIPYGLTATGFY